MNIVISIECLSAKSRPKSLNWALGKSPNALTAERRRWYYTAEKAWKAARAQNGSFQFTKRALFICEYVTPGRLGDADNMAFVSKAILDGALKPGAMGHAKGNAKTHGAGLLIDDNPTHVAGILLASPRHPEPGERQNPVIYATLTDDPAMMAFMYQLTYGK